jgi:hypothetical protein
MAKQSTIQLSIGPDLFPRVVRHLRTYAGLDTQSFAARLKCTEAELEKVEAGEERASLAFYDAFMALYPFHKITQICLITSMGAHEPFIHTTKVGPLELKQLAILLKPSEMKILEGGSLS